jgi:hypothetical protein
MALKRVRGASGYKNGAPCIARRAIQVFASARRDVRRVWHPERDYSATTPFNAAVCRAVARASSLQR